MSLHDLRLESERRLARSEIRRFAHSFQISMKVLAGSPFYEYAKLPIEPDAFWRLSQNMRNFIMK